MSTRNFVNRISKPTLFFIPLALMLLLVTKPSSAKQTASNSNVSQLPSIRIYADALDQSTEETRLYTLRKNQTATGLMLTPRETPQSVSTITRQVIEDFALNSIDKVMDSTPGIGVVKLDSERSQYYSRGFQIESFQYDGLQVMYDPRYAAGQTLSDMSIYDRVDILKGVSGLVTGTGAPGGTINMVRKRPSHMKKGYVLTGIGQRGYRRSEFDFGGTLSEDGNLRARAVAAYDIKGSSLARHSRKTKTLYGIIEFDIQPSTTVSLGAHVQNTDPKGSTAGGIAYFRTNGNFNEMPRSFNNSTQWSSMAQYSRSVFTSLIHTFSNNWEIKAQVARQVNGYHFNSASINMGLPNADTGSGTVLIGAKYDGKTINNLGDISASGTFSLWGREHQLVLGASASNRTWINDNYLPQFGFVSNYYTWNGEHPEFNFAFDKNINSISRERGLYTAQHWNIKNNLKLLTGARLVRYSSKHDQLRINAKVIPYFGITYDINNDLSAYLSYSSIFMPQAARDSDDKVLSPKDGVNKEVGIKWESVDKKLNARLSYFDVLQDNVAEIDPASIKLAYKPLKGVHTKGYELELTGNLTDRLKIQGGFSHNVSRQNGIRVSTVSPANLFTINLSRDSSDLTQGLKISLGARWHSKTWGDPIIISPTRNELPIAPSYWLIDTTLRYNFNKQLSAVVNLSNVFNKKYFTIFREYGQYTWGDARSVDVSLKYNF